MSVCQFCRKTGILLQEWESVPELLFNDMLDLKYSNRKIFIIADFGDKGFVEVNDTIMLTAVLSGYNGIVDIEGVT